MLRAAALRFVARTTRAYALPKIPHGKLHVWATIASPLALAAIVIVGLILLGAENLTGRMANRQLPLEHSTAIQNLLLRH
jgi:hypothetical protein